MLGGAILLLQREDIYSITFQYLSGQEHIISQEKA